MAEQVIVKQLRRREKSKFGPRPEMAISPAGESYFPEEPGTALEAVPLSIKQRDLEASVATLPQLARLVVVKDQESLSAAEQLRGEVKAKRAEVDAAYDPRIGQAFALHKGLLSDKRRFTDQLDEAERILNKQKIAPYLALVESERREAERKRSEAETKAREEASKAVTKSAALEADGKFDEAARVVEKASAKVDAVLADAPEVPEVETGLSLRKDWKFSVIDPKALPREYLCPDEKKIGRIVRASNGELAIPGVRIWSEDRVQ
jgi:hypothetical protein